MTEPPRKSPRVGDRPLAPRLYCDLPLAVNCEIDLHGERHHYLAHVLRLVAGSRLNLFNCDGEFSCRVLSVERRTSRVLCERAIVPLPRPRLHIKLYVSLAKGRSMDFVMQKAAELGAFSVQPVVADRSIAVAGPWERRLLHWRGVACSACEQCGRADVPEIVAPILFDQLEAPCDTAFVLDPDARPSLSEAARELSKVRVAALFGPEGGLTGGEVRAAEVKGFTPVSLGPRLLRVETAVTAALSVLQALAGDLAGDSAKALDAVTQ